MKKIKPIKALLIISTPKGLSVHFSRDLPDRFKKDRWRDNITLASRERLKKVANCLKAEFWISLNSSGPAIGYTFLDGKPKFKGKPRPKKSSNQKSKKARNQ